MEFFDKLTKKASETYKGATEKTGKLAKEAKLRLKIGDNKSKIKDIYEEIGKKVYQKHATEGEVCIKNQVEDECAKIDILASEIENYERQILDLSDLKECIQCKARLEKKAKFCPECGAQQPEITEKVEDEEKPEEVLEAEVVVEENEQPDVQGENTNTENE